MPSSDDQWQVARDSWTTAERENDRATAAYMRAMAVEDHRSAEALKARVMETAAKADRAWQEFDALGGDYPPSTWANA